MSAAPIPSADLFSIPKVPKLRSSCEGCGGAKVRCDRSQPECGRCIALGLTCVYGISRKFGKAPRKRLGSGAHPDTANSFSHKKRATLTAKSREIFTTTGSEPLEGVNKSAQLDSSDPATNILSRPSNDAGSTESLDSRSTMGVRESHNANKSAQLNPLGQLIDNLPVSSSFNPTPSIYEYGQLGSPFVTPFSLGEWPQFDDWEPGLEFPSTVEDSGVGSRPSASGFSPTSNLNTSSDSSDSHSCPRGSYELFRDLICPSPSLHAPEANSDMVSARLDLVLHFNRNAMDRLSRLLKCPCAKSGHRVMVHASIVSRILIWYQQAAGWTGSSSWGVQPSGLASLSPSSGVSSPSPPPSGPITDNSIACPPSLAQSTGFAVAQVPVSMGTFNVEDQDLQAAFRNQLVLSELKKTANLIDLFICQGSGESSANGVASLYSHLGVWLQSEHSRTVGLLRARLSALNEALES
ncbi:uncharacterized protein BP5553_06393 [Venustampulla echinocandica]|uniref:Zn(2)-C6 fungal-type domain-containing protein n=1 Tax=Venustampulla echinocandica TaxID=2656787 RepID=A0A370TJS9_9HELO|nr:uncharacterized protein BP5553_06393 [Venustampulla echinocandica]RDL35781.1 hypothetical protein BP5553_06393 [Venustampulla echinocandica]